MWIHVHTYCLLSLETSLSNCFYHWFFLQLIGEALSADDPDRDALWEFIDLLYVLIDPSVDGALRMFPFLRHLPGYYGNVYRQTIVTRDKVSKRFFEDQKVRQRFDLFIV